MNPIKSVQPMGFIWETEDPFLFCVHHEDNFPKGNSVMGPDASHFSGRHLGEDFIIKDGFRMYHGKTVPGFPGHPHKGFETITIVRKGFVDHSDSLGAAGRYGNGDVQWMTAGKGVQHAEMFPLLDEKNNNPLELFQIWLNLPKKNKNVEPFFEMFWKENIPVYKHIDGNGKTTEVELIAGTIDTLHAPAPPPHSWASDKNNDVAIWNIKMQEGASWKLPASAQGINRKIYIYESEQITINGGEVKGYHSVQLIPDADVTLMATTTAASVLLLQGRPINETVIKYGPFVMNSKQEINDAFEEYHKTQFGGWPWPKYEQVHERGMPRFAKHADGREDIRQ